MKRTQRTKLLVALSALAFATSASAQSTTGAAPDSASVSAAVAPKSMAMAEPMAAAAAVGVSKNVGIMGFYFLTPNISAFLVANGDSVVQVDQLLIDSGGLAGLDVIWCDRTAASLALANAAALEAWVRAGGTLITEFDATSMVMINPAFNLGKAAAEINGFWVPSGSVCGGNVVDVVDPASPIVAGLPASWSCSGDPIGVFKVFQGLDPVFQVAARVRADLDGDGVNEPVVAASCQDKGVWVPFFTDFADWQALEDPRVSCSNCSRSREDELLLFNAVAAAKDACVITVGIDIKPGTFPNEVNSTRIALIPVAIFGSATFDVAAIDPTTLMLQTLPVRAPNGNPQVSFKDVNLDGIVDMMVQFQNVPGTFAIGQTSATLTGRLFSGKKFQGTDSIVVVP